VAVFYQRDVLCTKLYPNVPRMIHVNLKAFLTVVCEKIIYNRFVIYACINGMWSFMTQGISFESPCFWGCPWQYEMYSCHWFTRRFSTFWSIYAYIKLCLLGRGLFWPQGLHLQKIESPCPRDTTYQISKHSEKWFIRRFFKIRTFSLF